MGLLQLKKLLDGINKEAGFVPMGGGQPPMPPMDPSMMGGAPAGAPPMDPNMMGGAPPMPPMDPNMLGGQMPMDPAAMGGAMPPMDPSMMEGQPPMEAGVDPMLLEAIRQVVREEVNSAGAPNQDGKESGDLEARISRIEDALSQLIQGGTGELSGYEQPMPQDQGMEGFPPELANIPPEELAGILSQQGAMPPQAGPMEVMASVTKDLDRIVSLVKNN